MAAPPSLPPMESTESFNPDFGSSTPLASDAHKDPDTPVSPVDAAPHDHKQDAPDPQVQQKVHHVLHSDIGVNTLLNRLKASIASARVGALARPSPGPPPSRPY